MVLGLELVLGSASVYPYGIHHISKGGATSFLEHFSAQLSGKKRDRGLRVEMSDNCRVIREEVNRE